MSLLSRFVIALIVLTLVAAAVAVGIVTFIDPNRMKAPITELVQEQTGLWIHLEGNLAWSLRPTPRIEAQNVRADWISDAPQPFAAADRVSFGIEIWPLLSLDPRIEITDIALDGLVLDLERNALGRGNWEHRESAPEGAANSGRSWRLERISITDAVVHYVDARAQQSLEAVDLDIDAQDVTFGEPFPLEIHTEFELVNQRTRVLMDIATQVTLNSAMTQVSLDELEVSGELARDTLTPISYAFAGRMDSDSEAGAASVTIETFTFGETSLRLTAVAAELYAIPTLDGHIEVDVPDTATLSRTLGLGEIPMEHVSLEMDFSTRGQAVVAEALRLRLDDLVLEGDLALSDADVPQLRFDLHTGDVQLDRYLELTNTGTGPGDSNLAEVELIKPAWFEDLHWVGRLKAERLSYHETELTDVTLSTRNEDGIVTHTSGTASVLGGTMTAEIELNLKDAPKWKAQLEIERIDARPLLAWLELDAEVKGPVTVEADLSATGNSLAGIRKSLAGNIAFSTRDAFGGTLSVRTKLDPQAKTRLRSRFEMDGIDGARLLDWLGVETRMQGRIAGNGELSASGDSLVSIEDSLSGKVSFRSDGAKFTLDGNELQDTRIEGDLTFASGAMRAVRFELESALLELASPEPDKRVQSPADATTPYTPLFDPAVLDTVQWDGRASIHRVEAGDLTLRNAEITTNQRGRVIESQVRIGAMLGGSVEARARLDASADPRWSTSFEIQGLDTQSLIDWLGYTAEVSGRMEVQGNVSASGNSLSALGDSVTGSLGFSSTRGTANIAAIKEIAKTLAVLGNRPGSVERWPDVIEYKRLTGSLGLAGLQDQRLDFALDNLVIEGKGIYDLLRDTVDYDVEITFRNLPKYYTFDIPPLFLDVTFPVHCQGPVDAKELCRLSEDAAGKIVAQLLRNEIQRQLFKGLERLFIPKREDGGISR
ncbi:MAG: AsmA family protein [Pseudomonadales bacterium]